MQVLEKLATGVPPPFPKGDGGRHDRRGSFHPLLDRFVSCVADSIDPPCLSESQLARTYLLEGLGRNIASCWHGFSLGSICFLWMFSLFLLSNWIFPSTPMCGCYPVAVPERTCSAGACLREDVSRCSGGTAPEPLASCCSNGVPIGAILWNLWTPHRSPLPCRARRRRPQGLGLSLCRQLFVYVGASRRTYRIGNCLSTWERLDCSIGGAPDLAFCILVLTLLPEPSFPILLYRPHMSLFSLKIMEENVPLHYIDF